MIAFSETAFIRCCVSVGKQSNAEPPLTRLPIQGDQVKEQIIKSFLVTMKHFKLERKLNEISYGEKHVLL